MTPSSENGIPGVASTPWTHGTGHPSATTGLPRFGGAVIMRVAFLVLLLANLLIMSSQQSTDELQAQATPTDRRANKELHAAIAAAIAEAAHSLQEGQGSTSGDSRGAGDGAPPAADQSERDWEELARQRVLSDGHSYSFLYEFANSPPMPDTPFPTPVPTPADQSERDWEELVGHGYKDVYSYDDDDCKGGYKDVYCDDSTIWYASDCDETCSNCASSQDLTAFTSGMYTCTSDSQTFYVDGAYEGPLPGCYYDECSGSYSYSSTPALTESVQVSSRPLWAEYTFESDSSGSTTITDNSGNGNTASTLSWGMNIQTSGCYSGNQCLYLDSTNYMTYGYASDSAAKIFGPFIASSEFPEYLEISFAYKYISASHTHGTDLLSFIAEDHIDQYSVINRMYSETFQFRTPYCTHTDSHGNGVCTSGNDSPSKNFAFSSDADADYNSWHTVKITYDNPCGDLGLATFTFDGVGLLNSNVTMGGEVCDKRLWMNIHFLVQRFCFGIAIQFHARRRQNL